MSLAKFRGRGSNKLEYALLEKNSAKLHEVWCLVTLS